LQAEWLELQRKLGNILGVARALNHLGLTAVAQADLAAARAWLEESLAVRRAAGDQHGVCACLNNLGIIARYTGDSDEAIVLLGEAIALDIQWGFGPDVAFPLAQLGWAVLERGEPERAHALLAEALRTFLGVGNKLQATACLEGLAAVASAQRDFERAARLLGAAEAARQAIGAPLRPVDQPRHEALRALARTALGEHGCAVSWAAGRAMSLDDASAYALGAVSLAADV
jgi:tetratricopeptide (TPR) repeat protein